MTHIKYIIDKEIEGCQDCPFCVNDKYPHCKIYICGNNCLYHDDYPNRYNIIIPDWCPARIKEE